jgi:ABC-type nitrate/sulfonate/bicarbonate transport system substrate-binding protein
MNTAQAVKTNRNHVEESSIVTFDQLGAAGSMPLHRPVIQSRLQVLCQKMVPPLALAVLLLATGSVARAAGPDLTLMRVGYGGIAGYQLPLWVSKELGISRKYGIEVEPLLIGGGSLNMQALIANSTQMSQNSASSAIQAALRNAPVVLVATLDNKMPFQIVARPEIKDPQQLKGKKIGIQRFGGSNDIGVQWALRAWNIDLRQVTLLPTGSTTARMSALVLGHVDASIFSYPEIYHAKRLGMNVLADIGDFSAYPNTSLMVTRSFLGTRRALLKNMLKAYVEAIRIIRSDKPASLKVLRKYLGITDAAAVEATYDFFSRRFDPVPRTSLEGITHILKEMDAPQRNPADFVDRTLLEEIEKESAEPKLR